MEVIGPLQARVMEVIWRDGDSTVSHVHEKLSAEPGAKRLAYTTILTVMRNLARRGILSQEHPANMRSHMFVPLVTRDEYLKKFFGYVRDTYCRGSQLELMTAAAAVA